MELSHFCAFPFSQTTDLGTATIKTDRPSRIFFFEKFIIEKRSQRQDLNEPQPAIYGGHPHHMRCFSVRLILLYNGMLFKLLRFIVGRDLKKTQWKMFVLEPIYSCTHR